MKNAYKIQLALTMFHLILSLLNFTLFLRRVKTDDTYYQPLTLAMTYIFQLFQSVLFMYFVKKIYQEHKKPLNAYLITLASMITVTNCLRVAIIFQLTPSKQNQFGYLYLALEIVLQLTSFQNFILSIEPMTARLIATGSFIIYSTVILSFFFQQNYMPEQIIQITLIVMSVFGFMLNHINRLFLQKQYQNNCLITQVGSPVSSLKYVQADQVIEFQDDRPKIIQNNVNIAVYNNQINPKDLKQMVQLESPKSQSDDYSSLYNYPKMDYNQTFNSVFKNSPIGVAIIDVHCRPTMFNDTFSFITQSRDRQIIQNLLANIKILKLNKKSQNQIPKPPKINLNFQDESSIRSKVNDKHRYTDMHQDKRFCTNDSQLFHSFKMNKTFSELLREYEITCRASDDSYQESLCVLDFESQVIDTNKTLLYVTQESNSNMEINRSNGLSGGSMSFLIYLVNVEEKQQHSQKKVTLNIMNQLFRSFSHEFSTSLNGIQALAQAAEDDLSKNRRVIQLYIEPILNSCGIMNSIVQDVRDFSMLLSKQFMIKIEYFNLKNVVTQVYELFAKQFEMRNIEFVYRSDESLQMISTDSTRLKQILVNLFSNAQKHTTNGPITVEITESKTIDFQKFIKISVQDCGCGMERDDQDRLDKILNNSLSLQAQDDNYKNFGIGLMISNQLSLILSKLKRDAGGGIYYQSQLNKGSKFQFLVADQQDDRLSDSKTLSIKNPARQSPMFQIDKRTLMVRLSHVPGTEKLLPYIQQDQKKIKKQTIHTQNSGQSLQNIDLAEKFQFISQLSERQKDLSSRAFKQQKKTFLNIPKIQEEYLSSSNQSNNSEEFDEFGDTDQKNFHFVSKVAMQPPMNQETHSLSSSSQDSKCSCTSVIVIDDEYINIFALQMLLKTFGIRIDCAYDGIEGVQKVLQKLKNPCEKCFCTYKLILMDIDMPGMNGFEATDKIVSFCELTKTTKPIIVAQTAYVDAQTQNRCIQVGMNFFLAKPISKTELRNALHFFQML